jgi:tetratricopeptide (TPR) repeat protein
VPDVDSLSGRELTEVLALAGKKLLSCLKKRDLLNSGKADKSELIKLGERYLHDNRLSDAIDFFEKAEHYEGLTQLKEQCVATGDYFLCHRLAKILEESPPPEEWIQLGDNALNLGKLFFARAAYQQAENPEKVAQVEKLLQSPPQEQVLH